MFFGTGLGRKPPHNPQQTITHGSPLTGEKRMPRPHQPKPARRKGKTGEARKEEERAGQEAPAQNTRSQISPGEQARPGKLEGKGKTGHNRP